MCDGSARVPTTTVIANQRADWFAMTGKLDELSQHIITGIWLIEHPKRQLRRVRQLNRSQPGPVRHKNLGDHRRAETSFRQYDGRFHRGAEMQLRGTFALDKLPHTLKRAMIMYYKCEKPSIPLPRDRWFSAC